MKRWSLPVGVVLVGAMSAGLVVNNWSHGQGAGTVAGTQPAATKFARDYDSYRDIVKEVLPAVVSVESHGKVAKVSRTSKDVNPFKNGVTPFKNNQDVPEEFRRFFEQFGQGGRIPSLPDLPDMPDQPRFGLGSGFFIDPAGIIVTNNHVVDGADSVTIELQDGRKFTSSNIHTDPRTDLAVIVLDKASGPFPYLQLGDSGSMELGDRVLAVGAPFGLRGTVTHGIVSGKARFGLSINMYEDFVQTDAPINPGNSGGPLISLDGKVIGINSAIKTRSGGFQGVGLAVSSNLAKNVVEQLRSSGVVKRGYLGVQVSNLDGDVAARFNLAKGKGVVVGDVMDNSPAAKAGLKAGDIVTKIDGKVVEDSRSLQALVASLPIAKEIQFDVYRDGNNVKLGVKIEEQPREFGTAQLSTPERQPQSRSENVTVEKLGVELADLSADKAKELGFKESAKGVVITNVEADSPAAKAGLKAGMLITKVERAAVDGADAARQALERASLERGILLQVQSATGGTSFVVVRG